MIIEHLCKTPLTKPPSGPGLPLHRPADSAQFGALQTAILELTLGRDDLITAMDVLACRISPL
jgi:hypothetical protein